MMAWTILAVVCSAVVLQNVHGQTTDLYDFGGTTMSTVDWMWWIANFGPLTGSSLRPWWDVTTTWMTTSEYPTSTEPPPTTIEPTEPTMDNMTFTVIVIVAILASLVVLACLIFICYRILKKRHRKPKRLRVKPLKSNKGGNFYNEAQMAAAAFSGGMMMPGMPETMMPPMDTMGMGMGMGMDMTGMGMGMMGMEGMGAMGYGDMTGLTDLEEGMAEDPASYAVDPNAGGGAGDAPADSTTA